MLTLNEFDFQKIARNPTTALTIPFVIFLKYFFLSCRDSILFLALDF
jgi:hypothetical protein